MAINRNNGGITGVKNKTSRGGNTITTMKASGNFQVQPGTNEVDLLVVAGGGGSGGDQGAGGGGAGGFQNLTNQSVSPGSTIPVTVGAGGAAGGTGTPEDGTSGGNSVFNNPANVVTSIGGGGGGLGDSGGGGVGVDGGSGGGGGGRGDDAGGSATTGQGNAGGKSKPQSSPSNDRGGGGGGAGAAGGDGANDPGAAGNGGAGAPSTVTGTDTDYAGGGGGGSESTGGTASGNGGSGGGGAGGLGAAGKAGQNNSGGGGGASGSAPTAGGAGGSGVVIVKEKDKANGMFNMNSQYHANKKAQWPNPSVYDITNSLRLYGVDNYEHLAHSATGNTKTMTFSFWFKDSKIGSNRNFFGHSSIDDQIFIRSDNQFQVSLNNSSSGVLKTNRVFRDPAAWYHIVIAIDTGQSTAADRLKLFINGTQETSLATETYPAQDVTLTGFNTATNQQYIGRERGGNYFGGYMADVNFIDGQALHCGHFGKIDPDNTRVWIPKNYEGTYGTNGYKLEFKQTGTSANSSGIGADTSGNNHHWTPNNHNSTHITEDTPTNNFATWNSLNKASNVTLSEANAKAAIAGTGQSRAVTSSIAVASGKWYWEIKYTTDVEAGFIGVITADGAWNPSGSALANNGSDDNVGYLSGGTKYINGSATSYGDGWDNGDMVSVLLNIDDNEVVFYKNGTAQDSGTAISKTFSGFYAAVAQHTSSSGTSQFEVNFGNPSFSISSGNADANGYGNFEYAVPSGYYALCTKNLAQYG